MLACGPAAARLAIRVPRLGQSLSSGARRTSASASAAAAGGASAAQGPMVLYDKPVSNNGARCRLLVYLKGQESAVEVRDPETLGGLRGREYLALNPNAKMPLLVTADGLALPESEVINQYLLEVLPGGGPGLVPGTPEGRALAALATRLHDVYICANQGCMYKAMPAKERQAGMTVLVTQLDMLESVLAAIQARSLGAPHFGGAGPCTADVALFPTFVFMTYMLPSIFGWEDVFLHRPLLRAWWDACLQLPAFARVHGEVTGGLQTWSDNQRWEKLGIADQVRELPAAYRLS